MDQFKTLEIYDSSAVQKPQRAATRMGTSEA